MSPLARLGLTLVLALSACALRPSTVTAEAAAGSACYGADACGPNGEVRVGASWDVAPRTETSIAKAIDLAPKAQLDPGDCAAMLFINGQSICLDAFHGYPTDAGCWFDGCNTCCAGWCTAAYCIQQDGGS